MSKTKSSFRRLSYTRTIRTKLPFSSETIVQDTVTPDPSGFTDTVVLGENIPGWRRVIAMGDNATTSLSGTRIYAKMRSGHLFRSVRPLTVPGWDERYGASGQLIYLNQPGPADASLLTEADRQAVVSFLKDCFEQQRALQALVTFGELGEALRMIKSPAKALRSGLDDYLRFLKGKRGKIPHGRKRTFIADTWLEYMFGWRPLFSDIQAGFEAVNRYHFQTKPYRRASGKGIAVGNSSHSSLQTQILNSGIHIGFFTHSWDEAHVKYYGNVTVLNPNGYLSNTRNLGADLRSFVPSVWELIPYSFLVDYFTNIGDVLSAFAFNQAELKWKARGTRNVRTIQSVGEYHKPWTESSRQPVANFGTPGKLLVARESVTRGAHHGSLLPILAFEIPGMSSLKWINMAALARSQKRLIPF